jgi:hypothetical protein
MTLLHTGYKKEYDKRLKPFGGFYEIGTLLGPNDKLLMHDQRQRLGIRARGVSDLPNNQGGISYGLLDSPGAVYDLLHGMGVTHVAWGKSAWTGNDSLASELVFQDFAEKYTHGHRPAGGLMLGSMPASRPTGPGISEVAFFGCNRGYRSGLYPLASLRGRSFDKAPIPAPAIPAPAAPAPPTEILARANALVIESRCPRQLDLTRFFKATQSKQYELWLHR